MLGILLMAFGTAVMKTAGFGVSMVVAPAYLLHLYISAYLPWFTFGVAEYALQAVLMVAMMLIMRRVRAYYFFAFITAILYGAALDACIALLQPLPNGGFLGRLLLYLFGLFWNSVGLAFLFQTYIAPEIYQLFVKELAAKLHKEVHRVKTCYDCISCAVSVLMSFAFFGFGVFEGVKLGTVFYALINGWLIGKITAFLHAKFEFCDRLPLRKYFQA
ncbi:MAG: DUF6198 family protein [Clostridia bacterium]|nr:DUF6198 family protein [Clostridia bacterium]